MRRSAPFSAAIALSLASGAAACALTHEGYGDASEVASPGTRIDCRTERCVGDLRDRDQACAGAPSDPAEAARVEVVSIRGPDGGPPTKGAPLEVVLALSSTWSGHAYLTPRLTATTLRDFVDVPLASAPVELRCGSQQITVRGGPFLSRLDGSAHFALATGDYALTSIALTMEPTSEDGEGELPMDSSPTASFHVATSNALLVPVLYEPGYLTQITGNPYTTPESYLEAAFRRPNQSFVPADAKTGSASRLDAFAGGFEQMMGVRHLFRAFADMPVSNPSRDAWCVMSATHARTVLGLSGSWNERAARHGFDYLLALTSGLGGGVACPWLDSQVSGFIDRDLDRQQIIVVHETGHLFGAPHCDDVGDGKGGPLQGYVMCSGEKHPNYPRDFVWHQTSRAAMRSLWR